MARMKLATTKLTIVALFAALCGVGTAVAATPLKASFKSRSGNCDGGFRCASGTVAGYGAATWTLAWDFSTITFTSRSCMTVDATSTIRLAGGAGELVLAEPGAQVCFPGNSTNAPGSLVSNGNPFRSSATWTVERATGRFAGVTGTGTSTARSPGNQASATFTGSLRPAG